MTLESSFVPFLQEKQIILFGGDGSLGTTFPSTAGFSGDAVRLDYFEAQGLIACAAGTCTVSTNLAQEGRDAGVSTSEENLLRNTILAAHPGPSAHSAAGAQQLASNIECLVGNYTNSPEVGSFTYFDTIKPCFVRAIKDLGILENIFKDENQSFFLVQMFQEIEEDLQHMLAVEDEKATASFHVEFGSECTSAGAIQPDLQLAATVNNATQLTFTVTDANGAVNLPDYGLSIAYTRSGGSVCPSDLSAQLTVPSNCVLGIHASDADAITATETAHVCMAAIQCGPNLGITQTFNLNTVTTGGGFDVDDGSGFLAMILRADDDNRNNLRFGETQVGTSNDGTGTGIDNSAITHNIFTADPIVGTSEFDFNENLSNVTAPEINYVFNVNNEPNDVTVAMLMVGPASSPSLTLGVVAGGTEIGSAQTTKFDFGAGDSTFTINEGGAADYDIAFAFVDGQTYDNQIRPMRWDGVGEDNDIAGVAMGTTRGKNDGNSQNNMISLDANSFARLTPSSITGNVVAPQQPTAAVTANAVTNTESSTPPTHTLLAIAGVILLALFVLTWRRKH